MNVSADCDIDMEPKDQLDKSSKKRAWYGKLDLEKRQKYEDQNKQNIAEKRRLNKANQGEVRSKKKIPIGLLENVPTSSSSLPRTVDCKHCKAKRFKGETNTFCCGGGEIYIESIPMPEKLHSLLVGTTPQSEQFRRNIRTYNNHFAFTTFKSDYDKELTKCTNGIYTFKIQGKVYHWLNPLNNPDEDRKSSGVQLYFFDTDYQQFEKRVEWTGDWIEKDTMKLLIEVLRDNPYAKFFKHLKSLGDLETKQIVLNGDPKVDQRTYNLPTSSQVACIYVQGEKFDEQQTVPIKVFGAKDDKGHNINHLFGCYDPLQYPLTFPGGHPGWNLNVKRKQKRRLQRDEDGTSIMHFDCPESLIDAESQVVRNGVRNKEAVTCREYYCYKMQMRDDDKSNFLHVGRLFQQFVCDAYIKIESSRLEFYRSNQGEFRTEVAQGVTDGIDAGLVSAKDIGQRYILPSSFTGGPRDMRKRYLDAMAIVQKYGKPDVFLTMTCNPYWSEIQDNLQNGEAANDRSDLVARVFKGKLEQLKDDLVKKEVLGSVQSLIYAIEYQKRGLPHCHMLIIFKPGSKPLGPEGYDRIVCAELPDPDENPHLFDVVSKNMMHGPCGSMNPKSPCMKNGKCKYGYPKPFRQTTSNVEDGYPLYKRRDDGRTVRVKKHDLGNDWVTPYNRYFSAKFECHINVEICSSIQSIKYVHKYIFKGIDKIGFALRPSGSQNEGINEIDLYKDGRWVGPTEAAWRIFGFKLNHMNPAVLPLQVHLPGQQFVSFNKQASLQTVASNELLQRTQLTAFFKTNVYDHAKQMKLLYKEFPEQFVWSKQKKLWSKRKNKQVIGRLVAVSPSDGENYYLRLLLLHVRGPKSYEDLRTVNGIEYPTFREAAVALGLLSSDDYVEDALNEACAYHMPPTLRSLFAILLVFCETKSPKRLWNKYKHELCSDFARNGHNLHHNQKLLIEKKVLTIIEGFLVEMGKDLMTFGLYDDTIMGADDSLMTREILSEKNIEIPPEELNLFKRLNVEQKAPYDQILQSVYDGSGKCYFIDGPGGTGKTFLYRALLARIRSEGDIALAVASSGVAASVLPGGRTAHSRFKLPLDNDRETCNISKQSGLARLIIEAKMILWDEATMAKRQSLESLDMLLKDLMNSEAPFGGKMVLFGGDFRQTLPVIPQSSREEMVKTSIVYSRIWPDLEKIQLKQNMRAINDPEFCSFLLRVGEGTEFIDQNQKVELPPHIIIPYVGKDDSLNKLIQCVFADLNNYAMNPIHMVGRCILAATNSCVDSINVFLIESFPGKPVEYVSIDRTLNDNHQSDYEDFLNTVNPKGLTPHRLLLKPNSPIMLIRNLNPTEGQCNGTRLICRELGDKTIRAEIAFGQFKGKQVFIPRITLSYEGGKSTVPFTRNQFPVRLCFTMTINKSQGQTLDFVGLYLEQPVFSHGQLYVALSRAKTSGAVKVLLTPPTFDESRENNRTKNIVFTEIFDSR